jgi:hypothetical protein
MTAGKVKANSSKFKGTVLSAVTAVSLELFFSSFSLGDLSARS